MTAKIQAQSITYNIGSGVMPFFNTIPTLVSDQEVIQTQEQSISELLKAVREQSDQLSHQRVRIKEREEKVTARQVKFWSVFLNQNPAVDSVIVKNK